MNEFTESQVRATLKLLSLRIEELEKRIKVLEGTTKIKGSELEKVLNRSSEVKQRES